MKVHHYDGLFLVIVKNVVISGHNFNKDFTNYYQFLVTLQIKIKIMGRNTSISLGNHFENFIENSLSEGRYKNASEVVRAGLRLLEEEESKLQVLKKAIQNGLDSGRAEDFDPKKHLESLKAKRTNG